MRPLVPALIVAAIAGAALYAWRWPPEDAAGFVEIKRAFAPIDPRDAIRLDGVDVFPANAAIGADGSASVVVRRKTGDAHLDYARGEAARTLCTIAVRKNRIVTATLTQTRSGIVCGVRA